MKVIKVLFLLGITFSCYGQEIKNSDELITLPAKLMTLEDVINTVQSQSGIHFSYSNELSLRKEITFAKPQYTVDEILLAIKSATGIRYQRKANKIILSRPAKRLTISGYVRDKASNENLIGGSIYTLRSMQGTTTNQYGYFSISLPEDSVTLFASYAGYETMQYNIDLKRDTVINIDLSTTVLQEVVITAESDYDNVQERTQMSTLNIPIQQLKSLPVLAGEIDIMKSLQLLPGVQAGNEGTSGLYVRGGGPDQNLILLDGVPVYNASHLFGFLSVFNADAINHVELIKGGFPARYGGRISSVIDIRMKEGNKEKIKGEGSLGLIASKFTIEGPLKKDKATFIVSVRRTYLDLLARPVIKKFGNTDQDLSYYFYDVNTKFNYIFNNSNRLFLSLYSGNDKGFSKTTNQYTSQVDYNDSSNTDTRKSNLGWGNITTALRWNHILSPTLFSNIAATYSQYNFGVSLSNEISQTNPEHYESLSTSYNSGITDFALKADFDFTPTPDHYIRFGAFVIHHTFNPGATTFKSQDEKLNLNANKTEAIESGSYLENDFVLTKKIKVNAGLHFAAFSVGGKTFSSLQPRVSTRYMINSKLSAKLSYAQMTQFIHLLTNAGVGLSTDLWVPATPRVKPQRAHQIAAGLAYTPHTNYELTVEGYYKKMNGVIEYKDGASYLNTKNDWQTKVATGEGKSYGVELFLHKKSGKWNGWLGYTLSRSYRQFDELNNGLRFPYRYDRRHDVELTLNRNLSQRVNFSFAWIYGTGNAITLPVASYPESTVFKNNYDNGTQIYYYEGRNGFRLRSYHRLDVAFTFKKVKRWGERAWTVGLYNAYNRQNPFYVDFGIEKNTYRKRLYQYSLFPIIPSVSYSFKF